MKYLKFAVAGILGFPIGVIVIVGGVVGIIVNAFTYGYNTIAQNWLDTFDSWMNV